MTYDDDLDRLEDGERAHADKGEADDVTQVLLPSAPQQQSVAADLQHHHRADEDQSGTVVVVFVGEERECQHAERDDAQVELWHARLVLQQLNQ